MSLKKRIFGVVFSICLLCIGVSIFARGPVVAQDTDANGAKIRSLMEERRAVLQHRVEATQEMTNDARGNPLDVIAARSDLLDAELAMASNKEQRIDVLQRKLENAKQYEAFMEEQLQRASGDLPDALRATARRLQTEIDLLKEAGIARPMFFVRSLFTVTIFDFLTQPFFNAQHDSTRIS